jgi:3-deoxy-manno-octulosonate cytidylyltransferase (CMP-KDO synthetase)
MTVKTKIVIPARYGSSRLPGKPLLELDGKPLFWHVVQQSLKAGFAAEDVIVATDHSAIVQAAKQLDVPVVLTDVHHASGTDRLNEVARRKHWPDKTLVINVQGDEPLIPSELIRQLAVFSQASPQFDICTVVTSLQDEPEACHNPNVVKVAIGADHRAVYFSRAPVPYHRDAPEHPERMYRHIGIYAYTVESLKLFCSYPESELEKLEKLEQLRALSHGLRIGVMPYHSTPHHGIDTEQDYLTIKQLMEG